MRSWKIPNTLIDPFAHPLHTRCMRLARSSHARHTITALLSSPEAFTSFLEMPELFIDPFARPSHTRCTSITCPSHSLCTITALLHI